MHFQQFYLACLAHASYLVGDGDECAIVDPQRDVDQYIEEAARRGLRIRYVIETHLHADFVSGHRELAARTGAEIVIGARAEATFPHRAVQDGDRLRLGAIELMAMETPGHTPESVCWLIARDGKPEKVLTGDTLFIGDVGRPDLAGSRGYTSADMAAMLYDSLHGKLLALPDDVEVWPAHGAGSACGKNISKETSSTIGLQHRTNYALRPMPREEFVATMTADLADPPPYFARDAEINRHGARALSDVAAVPLSEVPHDAIVLDVREADTFCAAHIPGAINIGLGGQFASWCGTLLPFDAKLVVVADDGVRAEEAVMRLARVGMENVAGFLVFGDWRGPTASIPQISVASLRDHLSDYTVLDVRRLGEHVAGHVPNACSVPLHQFHELLPTLPPPTTSLALICAGGYRSAMAASLLARAGYTKVVNVTGGTGAWVKEGYEVLTA